MEANLIPRKSTGDEIDKYLDKVFGGFPTPGEVETDQWQEKLGLSVSLDELDLIYTLQATEEENIVSSPYEIHASDPRMKTLLFLAAVRDMRVEMEQQLRQYTWEIQTPTGGEAVAIQKTMERAMDADILRIKVMDSAAQYCRQMTLRNVPPLVPAKAKSWIHDQWDRLLQYYWPSIGAVTLLEERDAHKFLSHIFIYVFAGLFLSGLYDSYFAIPAIPTEQLLRAAKSLLSKPALPDATFVQRFRFLLFKLNYTPSPLSILLNFSCATAPFFVLGLYLHTTALHLDFLLLLMVTFWSRSLGQRFWSFIRSQKAIGSQS